MNQQRLQLCCKTRPLLQADTGLEIIGLIWYILELFCVVRLGTRHYARHPVCDQSIVVFGPGQLWYTDFGTYSDDDMMKTKYSTIEQMFSEWELKNENIVTTTIYVDFELFVSLR